MTSDLNVISVVIADDHPLVLEGIAAVLGVDSGFLVVAKCATGRSALQAIKKFRPAVAVLDIVMPAIDGVEVLVILRATGCDTKVILLTAAPTDQQLLSAIEHGAGALMLKNAPLAALRDVVRRVAAGERTFPSELVDAALARQMDRATVTSRLDSLSLREREIVLLVAEGLSNKEVARKLDLSEGTVRVHLHNIFHKTGIGSRTALAAMFLTQR